MLTFRQLDDLPDAVVNIIAATEQEIINDMARRIAKAGAVTETTQWQLARLEAVGAERDYILHHLNWALDMSEQQLIRLFDEAATRTLAVDDAIYRAAGYNPLPLADNTYMQNLIRAGLKKTLEEYRNLTLTTAATATQQFENALDLAYQKITSGAFSYQDAIKAGIQTLTRNGLAVIQYPTGWVDYLDVAFRRATLTGVNQTAAEVQLRRMDEMETDLVETTAHHGARPDHAVWQGKWFSRSGQSDKYPNFYTATGYGTGPGLCGWNCRHSFFPVIEGLSDRAYSMEQLRNLNSRKVTVDGEEMSLYDATQQQRYMERKIRRWKREASAMEAAGLDSSAAKSKVREWQAAQRDFIRQTGLTRDYFRERAGNQNLETVSKDDIIIRQLRATGVKGTIHYPKQAVDTSTLTFDDAHINGERQHGVTEAEAKGFIENAAVSISRRNGRYENYYGETGVAYVDTLENLIRTAYKPAEFHGDVLDTLEVLKKNGR